MTRLLLVMLFTGPMNEMPPALKATGEGVRVGACVAVGGTCVADVVVAVGAGGGCPVVVLVPAHAVIRNIIRTAILRIMP